MVRVSPDDTRLAIVHGVDGRRVLSILDIASREVTLLPTPGIDVENDVLWLPPAGERLVFTS